MQSYFFFDKSTATQTADYDSFKYLTWPQNMSFPTFMNKLMTACEIFEISDDYSAGTRYELGKATMLFAYKKIVCNGGTCKSRKKLWKINVRR